MSPSFKKVLATFLFAFLLGFAANLAADAWAANPESGSIAPHCQRHGHNDTNRCGGEVRYFGAGSGYAQYSGSYSVVGHRHGGSEIETIYCMGVGGNTSCNWFHEWGSGLGAEQGCSTPSRDGCYPTDYTYQSGSFANFDNPNAQGAVYTIFEFVKDAEVTVNLNYTATPAQEENPGPQYHLGCDRGACVLIESGYPGQPNADGCTSLNASCGLGTHFACGNGACVSVVNGYPNQPNADGCNSLGESCGGGSNDMHLECVNNACQYVNGGGSDSCSTPGEPCGTSGPRCNPPHSVEVNGRCVPSCGAAGGTTCDAAACSGQPNFEAYDCNPCCNPGGGGPRYACRNGSCVRDDRGPFAGSDCAGSCEGPSQGYYQGNYQNYYQSYYEASYSHSECTSDGACVIVGGKGANRCSNDVPDCPQPPPTCTMSGVPSRIVIPPTQPITLTWSCSPTRIPTNCTITNVGSVGSNGSLVVRPTSSLTYTLNCTNASGNGNATIKARVFTGEPGSLKEIPPAR